MLRNIFSGNFDLNQMILQILYFVPVFLITIVVHECAHGYIAYKMGDPTAKSMGRLTLNPVKHMDPIGFIMMVFVGFGWAKPVPINPRYFKNPQKGMAISAAAGPASNILMAIAGSIIYEILLLIFSGIGVAAYVGGQIYVQNSIAEAALTFFWYFEMLNVYFAVFNLIPVPPLDGSRIVNYFLPPKLSYYYSYIERYGFLVLIILLWTGILSGPLQTISGWILTGIDFVIGKAFSLFW